MRSALRSSGRAAAVHSKVFVGAPAGACHVLGDSSGRQAGFYVIKVQMLEQIESDRPENMGVL
jgi:hypothetical protein